MRELQTQKTLYQIKSFLLTSALLKISEFLLFPFIFDDKINKTKFYFVYEKMNT